VDYKNVQIVSRFEELTPHEEEIMSRIVDSFYRVHVNLGPGLLEKVYEICLFEELKKHNLKVVRQVEIPIYYDGVELNESLRLDLVVEDFVIIELKAVEEILPVMKAQTISYLKLSNYKAAFLVNFHVDLIKHGIRRFMKKI